MVASLERQFDSSRHAKQKKGGGPLGAETGQNWRAGVKDGGPTARLKALAQFQYKALTKAFSFPQVSYMCIVSVLSAGGADPDPKNTTRSKPLYGLTEPSIALHKHTHAHQVERVVYSTCSLHAEEDEMVVSAALQSEAERAETDGGYQPFELRAAMPVCTLCMRVCLALCVVGNIQQTPTPFEFSPRRLLIHSSSFSIFHHRIGPAAASPRRRTAGRRG